MNNTEIEHNLCEWKNCMKKVNKTFNNLSNYSNLKDNTDSENMMTLHIKTLKKLYIAQRIYNNKYYNSSSLHGCMLKHRYFTYEYVTDEKEQEITTIFGHSMKHYSGCAVFRFLFEKYSHCGIFTDTGIRADSKKIRRQRRLRRLCEKNIIINKFL